MAKKSKLPSPAQASANPEGYDVGYGKPPAHTRFQPGKSGNPRGRPRGARNKQPALNEERLKSIVLDEAYRMVPTFDSGKKIKISMAEAVMRSISVKAAKGDLRSQKLFIELVNTTESANKGLHDEYLKTMIEYKTDWEEELENRRKKGLPAPDLVPHPDDIIIDMKTGKVRVEGPFTKEEKVEWDRQLQRLSDLREEIDELKKMLADKRRKNIHSIIEQELTFLTRHKDMIENTIGNMSYARRFEEHNKVKEAGI